VFEVPLLLFFNHNVHKYFIINCGDSNVHPTRAGFDFVHELRT